MSTQATWKQMDLSHLQQRLEEVKRLLQQASALAAAHDAGRLGVMMETQQKKAKNPHGNPQRPRYR